MLGFWDQPLTVPCAVLCYHRRSGAFRRGQLEPSRKWKWGTGRIVAVATQQPHATSIGPRPD